MVLGRCGRLLHTVFLARAELLCGEHLGCGLLRLRCCMSSRLRALDRPAVLFGAPRHSSARSVRACRVFFFVDRVALQPPCAGTLVLALWHWCCSWKMVISRGWVTGSQFSRASVATSTVIARVRCVTVRPPFSALCVDQFFFFCFSFRV